jgi:hypothetical protein
MNKGLTGRIWYHDGRSDFPHGAGPSEEGWYFYLNSDMKSQPNGPYRTKSETMTENGIEDHGPKMDAMLRIVITDFERRFHNTRPLCVLACREAADEHWQIYHPNDLTHPWATIDKDAEGFLHVGGR